MSALLTPHFYAAEAQALNDRSRDDRRLAVAHLVVQHTDRARSEGEIESPQRLFAPPGISVCSNAKAAHDALMASQGHSKVTEYLPALHTPEVARALAAHVASHPPTHLPVGGCPTRRT